MSQIDGLERAADIVEDALKISLRQHAHPVERQTSDAVGRIEQLEA
jgi:hypothetical protein